MGVPDSYTKVLLHMDGADTSTTVTDESGKTWTATGDAQIDTAQSVFGGASLIFNGTTAYVITDDHADFYLSGNHSIDYRVRFDTLPANGAYMPIWVHYQTNENYHIIYLYNNAGTYTWYNDIWEDGGSIFTDIEPATIASDTWYHMEFTRSGNNWYIFQNGTQLGSTTVDAVTIPNYTGSIYLGIYAITYFHGWIDEFRLSNGIARHTANFTPLSHAYGQLPKIKTICSMPMTDIKVLCGIPIDNTATLQGIT